MTKLMPDKHSYFMKCVKDSLSATYAAHPDYPKLSVSQLQSFVKRFLGQWNKVEETDK